MYVEIHTGIDQFLVGEHGQFCGGLMPRKFCDFLGDFFDAGTIRRASFRELDAPLAAQFWHPTAGAISGRPRILDCAKSSPQPKDPVPFIRYLDRKRSTTW